MILPGKHTALLHTKSELSSARRSLAEVRYLEMLEQSFGSPSKVRGAYCEYVAVRSLMAENPWEKISSVEQAALKLWEEASATAAKTVFQQIQLLDRDAVFEMQVWRSATR